MLIQKINLVCIFVILFGSLNLCLYSQKINPFERPGSRQKKPAPIIRAAPPPPAPKSINPNIELRGIFKFRDEWHFSLFDRARNQGAWLKMGESFDDGKVEIEGFNPETEELKLKGGLSLTLKNASKSVLPVPSGQPVKKPSQSPKVATPNRASNFPGNRPRAITIPPRVNLPKRK
ncbi:MAG: hypothetical protein HN548_01235 [Opitutae bacterium]|mgnify:FL=1|jgi:hypothetical protein|nr:hypothetical protein [Opitutae bacterium]MBT5715424.1 hypothetical protein [Opitutae bacterium]